MRQHLFGLLMAVTAFGSQAAGLQARDLTGDNIADAYYDSALNISWLANWSMAAGSSYDDGNNANDGRLSWTSAMNWANALSVGAYSNWRLPKTQPVDGLTLDMQFSSNGSTDIGYALTGQGWGTASELGHLYYVGLGNAADPTQSQAGNFGPFSGVIEFAYWSESHAPTHAIDRFYFSTGAGLQGYVHYFFDGLHAVAVHDGDIGLAIRPQNDVPEPATLALGGLALLAAGGFRRRATAARPAAD